MACLWQSQLNGGCGNGDLTLTLWLGNMGRGVNSAPRTLLHDFTRSFGGGADWAMTRRIDAMLEAFAVEMIAAT